MDSSLPLEDSEMYSSLFYLLVMKIIEIHLKPLILLVIKLVSLLNKG